MLFQKNDTVLFIGDSISDYERKRPVGEGLRNAWGTSYVACAGALLGSIYPELALRVINMGVSGNQTRDLIARWQTDVMDLRPDWVCMLIGINDVWRQFDQPQMPETHVLPDEYARNCESLIQRTLPPRQGHGADDPRISWSQIKAIPCARGWTSTARSFAIWPQSTACPASICKLPGMGCSSTCIPATLPGIACIPTRRLHVHCPPAAKRRGL